MIELYLNGWGRMRRGLFEQDWSFRTNLSHGQR